ncbi:galactosyltransferase-related protein [Alkalihalobacterium alkalinitrilicum]|uniref:galactosyltransferase-related protein n=1 Tax=Alkalihalobacterium alkalinitrilicum TaxID=427920 RepID=UPI001C5A49C4|nr:galactosyltransferase-related protein [Alkalihalobacterium alkalinitrilicum]
MIILKLRRNKGIQFKYIFLKDISIFSENKTTKMLLYSDVSFDRAIMKGEITMLNNVSVLIPYKPDNGVRDNLFKWVRSFYENVMPDVELCIGEDHSELFNRSRAINTAAQKASKEIFVIADGDVIYNPEMIVQAIKLLDKHAWVIPYRKWLNLDKESTEKILKISPEWPLPIEVKYKQRGHKRNKKPNPESGVLVLPRKNFNIVEGFDERFKGWGKEDRAFCIAMNTLCGPYKRIEKGFLYHLWHPSTGAGGNPHFEKNNELYLGYVKCRGNKSKMKNFIRNREI